MQPRHRFVGHHHRPLLRQHRRQQRAGAGQQPVAHHHVVAAAAQRQGQPPRRLPGQQRVQHLAGGDLRALVAAIDDDVGLGIDRVARGHQPLQHLGRVAAVQQRPMGAPGDAAQQRRQRAAQPDRDGLAPDRRAGLRVHERAAAGRQHQRLAGQQPADHAALAVAELRARRSARTIRARCSRPPARSRRRRRGTAARVARPAAGRSRSCPPPSARPARCCARRPRRGRVNDFLQGGVACHGARRLAQAPRSRPSCRPDLRTALCTGVPCIGCS